MTTTKVLVLFSAVAALVALTLASGPAVAGSLCFVAGVLAIFAADYGRARKALTPRAAVVAFAPPARPGSLHELAA